MPRIMMANDGNLMNPPGAFQRKWTRGEEIDCTQIEADALRSRGVSYSLLGADNVPKETVTKSSSKAEKK